MTIYERRAALFFILLGIAVAVYSTTALNLGSIHAPGPGLFPFVSGAGTALLCVFWLVSNRKYVTECEPLWAERSYIQPLLAVAITCAYAALMEPIGYIPSTLVFLVAWQKIIEREKWPKTIIIAVVATAVMYGLFVYLLGTSLPEFEM